MLLVNNIGMSPILAINNMGSLVTVLNTAREFCLVNLHKSGVVYARVDANRLTYSSSEFDSLTEFTSSIILFVQYSSMPHTVSGSLYENP